MDTLVYALAFFPLIILIALTVHEGGHLLAAKALGIKPAAFQIGLGPKLFVRYTGKTRVRIPEGQPVPEPGQLIRYWANPEEKPGGITEAAMWQPSLRGVKNRNRVYSKDEIKEIVRQAGELNRTYPSFNARVKSVEGNVIAAADMEWSLAAFPVAAMVQVSEDPAHRAKNCFNTAKWRSQMLVIAAGALANIALLGAVIMLMALIPSSRQAMLVREVAPGSPAESAGIRPGDVITRGGSRLFPAGPQLREEIGKARAAGRSLGITVSRQGKPLNLSVPLGPDVTAIGIRYETGAISSRTGGSIIGRFTNLTRTYANALTNVFHHSGITRKGEDGERAVTGIIHGGATAGQVVKVAGLQGFLAMLGVITMSMAIINLLPVPPLDGYQLVLRSLRAFKGGRPLNEKAERAVALSGMAAIMTAALYLMYQDIAALLAQHPPIP